MSKIVLSSDGPKYDEGKVRPCPVCDFPLLMDFGPWGFGDHATPEEHGEECTACRLYDYRFSYGTVEVRYGMVDDIYVEIHPSDGLATIVMLDRTLGSRREYHDLLLAEAKRIHQSDTGRALFKCVLDYPGDTTPLGVFADWCAENGLPLNEAAARKLAKGGGE